MMKLIVGYNTKEEELEIARRVANNAFGTIETVATKSDLERLKSEVREIHIDKEVEEYIVDLVFATREPQHYGLAEIKNYIAFGASPRASIDMFKATKALSYIRGKDHVTPLEVAYIAKEILRHRIILSYEAEAEGITSDTLIEKVLEVVPIP